MEDSDSRRSTSHHPSWPERRWLRSPASDENDPANRRPGFWTNTAKPSGTRKITSPAKKVLGERNGSGDLDGSVETAKPRRSLSEVSESKEDAFSLSPYDPFKNYLMPRPKFLRYRPDRPSEVLTHMRDKEDEKEISRIKNLGKSFSDVEKKYSDGESEEEVEEEEEEENVEQSYGMKGLIKKLAWFVLFLFSASYIYHVDVSEEPAEGIDSNEYGFSSWPIHNFTNQAASENIGVGLDSLYGEHTVLAGESECDDGNEVTLGKIEEEMLLNFWDDHLLTEYEELTHSGIQNSRFVDDNQEHAVMVDGEDEVQQKSEGGYELSEFEKLYPPTAVNLQFVPGKIIDEKFTSSEYPTQEEFEIPKAQDQKNASIRAMIILSLSIPFLIASSLFLGMLVKRDRSSPNIFRSQATQKLFEGQPVVHSSCNAELQSPEEYQMVPRTSAEAPSAVYPKDVNIASLKHRLAPGVELLGEFTFRGRSSSHESKTVTKLQNIVAEQNIDFTSAEKLVLEVSSESPFIMSPSPGSPTFAKKKVDKGTNGSTRVTPTPLRRSNRLRNRAVQSP